MNVLIVGAGLYGAVCAQALTRLGHRCRVIEQREHVGGLIYTRYVPEAACHEHVYGPQILHTNSSRVWRYLNRFATFYPYVHRVRARHDTRLFSFPVNLITLCDVFGTTTPLLARLKLAAERVPNPAPATMEQYCLSTIGPTLYQLFFEGYTSKLWGRHPATMPPAATSRLPLRLTCDDRYFCERYQGLPRYGYTPLIEALLEGVPVQTGIDFNADREAWMRGYDRIVYTGALDAFFDYRFGALQYRSLRIERELLPAGDFQGCAVIHHTARTVPFTRTIEHRHFAHDWRAASHTLVTREYPTGWHKGLTGIHIVDDAHNARLLGCYRQAARALEPHVHFGGRLALYPRSNMDQIVEAALAFCEHFH
jgi:UDP-galactopyranose mutase